MADCIFCKIVGGEIPAFKIYEDADFLAFLDVNPRTKGHTLIIPKHHASTLLELPDNHVRGIFLVVKKVAGALTKTLGAKAFTIGSNNGELSGQAVSHLHIHIIPRYETDKHHAGFEAAFPVDEEEKTKLNEIVLKIGKVELVAIENIPDKKDEHKEGAHEDSKKKKGGWKFLHTDSDG